MPPAPSREAVKLISETCNNMLELVRVIMMMMRMKAGFIGCSRMLRSGLAIPEPG